MNQKQKKLEALARKNAAKAKKLQSQRSRTYDATLDATRPKDADESGETTRFFKEMKRREF
jgi:hypothetical protein